MTQQIFGREELDGLAEFPSEQEAQASLPPASLERLTEEPSVSSAISRLDSVEIDDFGSEEAASGSVLHEPDALTGPGALPATTSVRWILAASCCVMIAATAGFLNYSAGISPARPASDMPVRTVSGSTARAESIASSELPDEVSEPRKSSATTSSATAPLSPGRDLREEPAIEGTRSLVSSNGSTSRNGLGPLGEPHPPVLIASPVVPTSEMTFGARATSALSPQNMSPAETIESESSIAPATAPVQLPVTAVATDPDGDALSFRWSAPVGSFANPAEKQTLFICPDTPGAVSLTITVSDGNGGVASDTVTVQCVLPTP